MFTGKYHLVLFINGKLPLKASKAHPHYGSTVCPLCQCDQEDIAHFLTCLHLECNALFTKLKYDMTHLTQCLSLHLCLFTAIWLGLKAACTDSPYPEILSDILPPLQQLIQQQTQLGWTQLFHGHVSTMWATAVFTIHPQLAPTIKQVMTQIQKLIWAHILETWKMRNQHLHRNAEQLDLPNYQQGV